MGVFLSRLPQYPNTSLGGMVCKHDAIMKVQSMEQYLSQSRKFVVRDAENFSEAHPELMGWEMQLTGTYTTCHGAKARPGYIPLEEIYSHIF